MQEHTYLNVAPLADNTGYGCTLVVRHENEAIFEVKGYNAEAAVVTLAKRMRVPILLRGIEPGKGTLYSAFEDEAGFYNVGLRLA